MKKKILKKIDLAENLNMKFDEVSDVLSEETLSSMMMLNTIGGDDYSTDGGCPVDVNGKCLDSDCHTPCVDSQSCPTYFSDCFTGCNVDGVACDPDGGCLT